MPKSQQRSLTSFFAPKTTSITAKPRAAAAGNARTEKEEQASGEEEENMSSNSGKRSSDACVGSSASTGQSKRLKKSTDREGQSLIKEEGWATALAAETSKGYFTRLQTFLDGEYSSKIIYPPRHQIFSAFDRCPLQDVKVVILGQDPYHGPGQAHGLAFSVMKGVPQPPSLRNMVKEAVNCCSIKPTKEGNLDPWCDQGVFLLNSVLSVEKAKAFSHQKKGWEQFTDAVIRELNKGDRRLVFMLWGKPSQKKGHFIDSSKHRVLKCAHPSPLSASRGPEPFIGSACFAKANEALTELGHDTVDWNVVT